MKLTEKELNEFPIGTKIYCGKDTIIKADIDVQSWRNVAKGKWYSDNALKACGIDKVEIPTYTEYIPSKPILDDKEKEYLSYVIRPFKDKIKNIKKREACSGIEFLSIAHQGIYTMAFPYFKAGTMYKGMELDKEYSLEELGL